jgi:hypothetical protein
MERNRTKTCIDTFGTSVRLFAKLKTREAALPDEPLVRGDDIPTSSNRVDPDGVPFDGAATYEKGR